MADMDNVAVPTRSQDGDPRRIAGRYRVLGELGSGAMGTVWSAYDEVLRRPVAVKEVRAPAGFPAAEAAALRERTLREARATAVLSHPNVVTLYDVVQVGGEPFVVMELVPSRSLAALIGERGRLGADDAAAVGTAVAAALATAHRAGITHRDVKPGNVLVGEDGRIKLTDFGIARNTAEVTMTATGLVLGSPAYIAPEVAAGREVSAAADLWGLGATLFAAVEGHPPYDAGDPVATVAAVVHGRVPRPSGGGPLAGVIVGLMVKQPHRRLPLDEVRRRLRPLLADPDSPLLPEPPVLGPIPWRSAAPPPSRGLASRDLASRHPPAPAQPSQNPPAQGLASPGLAGTGPRPLAADPGPLPFPLPPSGAAGVAAARSRGPGLRALLGALVLVAVATGGTGGYWLTRQLAGEPAAPVGTASAGRQWQRHVDSPQAYGPDALGFGMVVPAGWREFRLPDADGAVTVRFVSPDGGSELRVDREAGWYPGSDLADLVAQLTGPGAARRLGVADVERLSAPRVVGAPVTGGRGQPQQLSYRTRDAYGVVRTTVARLVPAGDDLWVLRLTVPGAGDAAEGLFSTIADSFTPAT